MFVSCFFAFMINYMFVLCFKCDVFGRLLYYLIVQTTLHEIIVWQLLTVFRTMAQRTWLNTQRIVFFTSHALRINCSCLHHNGMWCCLLFLLITSSPAKLPSKAHTPVHADDCIQQAIRCE